MKVIELYRKCRRQRIEDILHDAEDYLYKWKFGMKPSEIRKLELKIDRLGRKLERLEH